MHALVELADEPRIEIRRVAYDHEARATRMERAGIAPVFVEPIRTGVWTTGVASLPIAERHRWLRAGRRRDAAWKPELLDVDRWPLDRLAAHGLVSASELAEVRALLDPAREHVPVAVGLRAGRDDPRRPQRDSVKHVPSTGLASSSAGCPLISTIQWSPRGSAQRAGTIAKQSSHIFIRVGSVVSENASVVAVARSR